MKTYITGLGRDYPHPRKHHLYFGTFGEPGDPLCKYGWNRGDSYSIWRNNTGVDGCCKLCKRKADKLGLVKWEAPRLERMISQ